MAVRCPHHRRGGRDLNDITTVAKLPVEQMRPGAQGDQAEPSQIVEGFASSVDGDRDPNYADHRGGGESWRARVSDHSAVTWRTAAPPAALPTVFAFTGSTSDEEGSFTLAVDGLPALTFTTQRDHEIHSWSENGYTLVFISRTSIAGNSGFYLLSVPAARITPGQPLELRVTGASGDPAAWFMIKAYRDTLIHERVTAALAEEATRGAWRTRKLPIAVPQ